MCKGFFITYLCAVNVVDVLIALCITDDFVIISVVRCKIRFRRLELEKKNTNEAGKDGCKISPRWSESGDTQYCLSNWPFGLNYITSISRYRAG